MLKIWIVKYVFELLWTMLVRNAHSADSVPNHNLHIKVMVLNWFFYLFTISVNFYQRGPWWLSSAGWRSDGPAGCLHARLQRGSSAALQRSLGPWPGHAPWPAPACEHGPAPGEQTSHLHEQARPRAPAPGIPRCQQQNVQPVPDEQTCSSG